MKNQILGLLKASLVSDFKQCQALAQKSRSDSADPELVQKSKYETQGIEASYLADAHSKRLLELANDLKRFEEFESKPALRKDVVLVGSLVALKSNSKTEYYFISPVAVLKPLLVQGHEIKVISEKSPLAQELIGLKVGQDFEIEVKGKAHEFAISEIH